MTLVTKPFYITFGSQYSRIQHPKAINNVYPHPDGWMRLDAISKEHAMNRAKAIFGDTYSMCYNDTEFDDAVKGFFPRGELACIPFVPGKEALT